MRIDFVLVKRKSRQLTFLRLIVRLIHDALGPAIPKDPMSGCILSNVFDVTKAFLLNCYDNEVLISNDKFFSILRDI